jgi:hypothetical protein
VADLSYVVRATSSLNSAILDFFFCADTFAHCSCNEVRLLYNSYTYATIRNTGAPTYKRIHESMHNPINAQTHPYTHTQAQAHRHTGTQAHRHTGTQAHRYTGTHVRTHISLHTPAHKQHAQRARVHRTRSAYPLLFCPLCVLRAWEHPTCPRSQCSVVNTMCAVRCSDKGKGPGTRPLVFFADDKFSDVVQCLERRGWRRAPRILSSCSLIWTNLARINFQSVSSCVLLNHIKGMQVLSNKVQRRASRANTVR